MFKNPFSFDGRIRRMEYGLTFIIYIVVYMICLSLISVGSVVAVIGGVMLIPMVWFVWAQSAKRCHDVGKSGWWQLIPFYFFVLLFQDGDSGLNTYGSNPKEDPEGKLNAVEAETLDQHMRN
jgi:uncharacterized membrane protein YhaH (DUF805 family)